MGAKQGKRRCFEHGELRQPSANRTELEGQLNFVDSIVWLTGIIDACAIRIALAERTFLFGHPVDENNPKSPG
jgi:hypothetical protein